MSSEAFFSKYISDQTGFTGNWKYMEDVYTGSKAICARIPKAFPSSITCVVGAWLHDSEPKALHITHAHWDPIPAGMINHWAYHIFWLGVIIRVLQNPPKFLHTMPTILEDLESLALENLAGAYDKCERCFPK